MKEVTAHELKSMMDNKEDFQLIDVREPLEFEISNLNGELIPLGEVIDNAERIVKDKKVVIHCGSGIRSAVAIQELERRFGYTNLYNLKGGIKAFAHEFGSSLHG
jgi:rhodanese-related sulfurtransferase